MDAESLRSFGGAGMAFLAGLAALLAAWQWLAPCRGDAGLRRWWINGGFAALSALSVRALGPMAAIAVAMWAQAHAVGLFPWLGLAGVGATVAGALALDAGLYWQHRAFHRVPWLWRAHRVHHFDIGFDLSLGLRFHPFEAMLSALYKSALVAALGIAPDAAAIHAVFLTAMSLFSHADARLPRRLESRLRWLLVTPDWHRVHHSARADEGNANFASGLTLWDRCFGTAVEQPRAGHAGMRIGLPDHRSPAWQGFSAGLISPLLAASDHRGDTDA